MIRGVFANRLSGGLLCGCIPPPAHIGPPALLDPTASLISTILEFSAGGAFYHRTRAANEDVFEQRCYWIFISASAPDLISGLA
jgi:hypothetical protein